ncbi:hypothetical protein L873DRAFT_1801456, partial [Choiromyces venosus 120613-1]
MSSRKPLQVQSSNRVSISCPSKQRKTVKQARRAVEIEHPNPTERDEIDGQFTAKPEILETFIPLPHRFPPHDPKPKLTGSCLSAYDFFSQF